MDWFSVPSYYISYVKATHHTRFPLFSLSHFYPHIMFVAHIALRAYFKANRHFVSKCDNCVFSAKGDGNILLRVQQRLNLQAFFWVSEMFQIGKTMELTLWPHLFFLIDMNLSYLKEFCIYICVWVQLAKHSGTGLFSSYGLYRERYSSSSKSRCSSEFWMGVW